ncbi:hypothetical protein [Photorhabdus viridis]|uniref:hypothetical protein n=1 Tax=Photorhabdus viridis TaxID=3163327 RepID=UPI00330722D5
MIGKQCWRGYFSQGDGSINNALSLVLFGVGATNAASNVLGISQLLRYLCWIYIVVSNHYRQAYIICGQLVIFSPENMLLTPENVMTSEFEGSSLFELHVI